MQVAPRFQQGFGHQHPLEVPKTVFLIGFRSIGYFLQGGWLVLFRFLRVRPQVSFAGCVPSDKLRTGFRPVLPRVAGAIRHLLVVYPFGSACGCSKSLAAILSPSGPQ